MPAPGGQCRAENSGKILRESGSFRRGAVKLQAFIFRIFRLPMPRFATFRRALAAGAVALCPLSVVAQGEVLSPRFAIQGFDVAGNSVLDPALIEETLAPLNGPERSFADIRRAVELLEASYRRAGYSLVQIVVPEQELRGGRVRLTVHEHRIARVDVEGAAHFSEQNIRASLPGLQPGRAPNMDEVSRSLRIANDSPAKKTVLQLGSATADGSVDARLKVADERPWRIGATLDNTGLDSTGKHRLGVALQHANLFDRDHLLALQYTTSLERPSDVSIYGLGYRIPLYAQGDAIDLFAGYSDVSSGTLATGGLNLSVSGKGAIYGLRYNQTLARLGSYEQRLIYGLDYRAYENDISFGATPLGSDVTVRPASLGYAGKWTLATAEATAFLTAVRNLPGGSDGDDAAFERARLGAAADYSLLRFGASGRWAFAGEWQGALAVNGQWTADRLIPGEQFGLGGATSVRGFRERAYANDSGALLSAELQTPEWCGSWLRGYGHCRLVGFYDAGRLRRNDPLAGEQAAVSLASAGVGLRYSLGRQLSWRLDAARVVDDGGSGEQGKTRYHFLMAVSY